ncbi:MAG: aspartate/glutamate racemase family protein [Anaerovoracaceae bacterium]|jgi:aspartate racemase
MWENEGKLLGVLGGMGPLATQLFYRQVIERTDAKKDQEHLNMVILNHATMPDRTQSILSGFHSDIMQKLKNDAKTLETMGAVAIAVPCNTSHYYLDEIQKEISIPFIHMIREAVAAVATGGEGVKKVGILATTGTISGGMYQESCLDFGLMPIVPSEKSQDLIMGIIYEGIKNGGEINFEDFLVVERELKDAGCHSVIMACTELSCFKEMYNLPGFYVDAMEILAIRSIERCGKQVKVKECI